MNTASITDALESYSKEIGLRETMSVRYLAQSALTGIPMRDHGPAPILPADQAADVVRWQYPHMEAV